jgi:hypothetical protein
MKEKVAIELSEEEINNLIVLVEDRDREEAYQFCREIKKKIDKIKKNLTSIYHKGDHIGSPKLK